MKQRILIFSIIAVLLAGCKQSDYVDWKSLNEGWLVTNSQKANVKVTQSGLQYKQLNPSPNPTEARPNPNSTININYKLYLISSFEDYAIGNPVQQGTEVVFSMANLIPGFSEGLQLMHVHDDFILYIPASLGYGSEAVGTEGLYSFIPPYSTLIYEVHLNAMQ